MLPSPENINCQKFKPLSDEKPFSNLQTCGLCKDHLFCPLQKAIEGRKPVKPISYAERSRRRNGKTYLGD